MGLKTAIEWTDTTWNPVLGCTEISPGCDNCYARKIAERFEGTLGHPFENGFQLSLRHNRLLDPLSWRKPRRVFVNSMSDLFHKEVPHSFLDQVFDTMERADWHVFQVLTKRSPILRTYVNERYTRVVAPPHIWLGVSIENRRALSRLPHLRQTNASVRFVSFEPLLEDLGEIDLAGIHWAIVGGESGLGSRPMREEWVDSIYTQCHRQSVPFFFKQWGAWGVDGVRRSKKSNGRAFKGGIWNEMPTIVSQSSF